MPYIRERCWAGKTYEERKYFAIRYGKRGEKAEDSKELSDCHRRAYERRIERELRRILNANFRDGTDALVTLAWKKGGAPETYEEILREVQRFIRKLRRKQPDLKYVYTLEIGPRGAKHIHMVLSDAETKLIRSCWPGTVNVEPLWSEGQYGRIASYFVKYANTTEIATGKKLGKRYNASRNLIRPKVKKEIVGAKSFKPPGEVKGYYLAEKKEGFHEVTGSRYQEAIYVKT